MFKGGRVVTRVPRLNCDVNFIFLRENFMRWVTRERPKIDRIACPWLVLRFIDPEAEFLYVPPNEVSKVAAEKEATPYDVLYAWCRDLQGETHNWTGKT